jgi:hypothetical protein
VAIPVGTPVFVEGPNGSPSGYTVVRHCFPTGDVYSIGLELSDEAKKSGRASGVEDSDYYEFLQINPKAGQEAIHRVYRFMAARFHPDNPDTGDVEKFLLLNRAYESLSDPQRRAEYDAARSAREVTPDPIFGMSTFVNGIEGEVNRRLAILAILYNKRRMNSSEPGMSLWDLEKKMSFPREYLDFAVWYLKAKGYVTLADNSDLTLTVTGVDYVEGNSENNVTLEKLLHAGHRAATDLTKDWEHERRFTTGMFRLTAGKPAEHAPEKNLEIPRKAN